MSWLSDSTELLGSGWLSSVYPGHGIRGVDIPASGVSGGSPFINDGIGLLEEYRWKIESFPSAGTLAVFEDLTFVFSGAPDGTYSFTYRAYENGADYGTAIVYLQVGPANFSFSATLADCSGVISFGSVTVGEPFFFSLTLDNVTSALSFTGTPGTVLDPSSIRALADAFWSHPNALTFMRAIGLK